MSTGLKHGCLKEPGQSPRRPQPQPRRVQVFMPPPRLLAFPEIVTKRSLVFAQIVSPHGKTSPGWFTLAFIVLLGSTSNCTELRASAPAPRGCTPVAITSSHTPRSPLRTENRPQVRHHPRRGRTQIYSWDADTRRPITGQAAAHYGH